MCILCITMEYDDDPPGYTKFNIRKCYDDDCGIYLVYISFNILKEFGTREEAADWAYNKCKEKPYYGYAGIKGYQDEKYRCKFHRSQ
jgi:hypothetical protein